MSSAQIYTTVLEKSSCEDGCIGVSLAGRLRPTTSISIDRYYKQAKVEPSHVEIEAGLFLYSKQPEPAYLPPRWSAHIHPEGQLYFCRDKTSSTPRIVTEAYLYRPDIMSRIGFWLKLIDELLYQSGTVLSDDVELFLQLEGSDSCAYYCIDVATQSEFWIESLSTELLDLPAVVSTSHLKLALAEHYWVHVEHFPMHRNWLSLSAIDELICIFSHGQADRLTSKVSTFPYPAKECTDFIGLLKTARYHPSDGNITCLVARLWTIIAHHRFSTHYGQEHARLSRDQAIVVAPIPKKRWLSVLSSRLSFGGSEHYLARLDDLFVDDLVYIDQWRTFVSTCLEDWRGSLLGASFSLILHALLFFVPASPILGAASAFLFASSVISSVLLTFLHKSLEDVSASEAANYLDAARFGSFGFQLLALIFSLPKTFYLWGLGVFFWHWMVIVTGYFNVGVAVALVVFMAVTVLSIWRVTCSNESPSVWHRLFRSFVPGRQIAEVSKV